MLLKSAAIAAKLCKPCVLIWFSESQMKNEEADKEKSKASLLMFKHCHQRVRADNSVSYAGVLEDQVKQIGVNVLNTPSMALVVTGLDDTFSFFPASRLFRLMLPSFLTMSLG